MSKSTFFTLSDYRAAAHLVASRLRTAPPRFWACLVAAQLVVLAGSLSIMLIPDASKAPWSVWVAVGLGWVVALVLQAGSVLTVRQRFSGQGEVSWSAGWDLLKIWTILTLRVGLLSVLVNLVVGFPSAVMGFVDGFNDVTTGEKLLVSVNWWPPFRQVLDSLANSFVGALYLWSFATAVYYPTYKTLIVQRWARQLSWRTWPLAVGFALLNLIATLLGFSGTVAIAWIALEVALAQAFVISQLVLLAEKTKATEFGP